ncbi:type II toxin-antitoxin system VapC family toxin [Phaeodactylibacter xiamenensis]|uniref:type II toxin-antitoxin system VapC family toxin n=1 Tax=Phaeodactylibacter xiamenensis TaxID=1524460 RepID=UPI003BAAEE98
MNYFFDTNAILIYLRDHVQKDWLDKNYDPLGDDNTAMISVVVLGELESLYLRNNWGRRRIESLRIFLRKFLITDINSRDIIRRYGEIDAFSQGKLKEKRLGDSSRNMGKNDLWIAATASVTNSRLISSDKDFNHLKGEYLDLLLIEI